MALAADLLLMAAEFWFDDDVAVAVVWWDDSELLAERVLGLRLDALLLIHRNLPRRNLRAISQ